MGFSLLQDVPPACVSPQRDCPPPAPQVPMSGRGHAGLSTPARVSQSCWRFIHLLLYKKSHYTTHFSLKNAEKTVCI